MRRANHKIRKNTDAEIIGYHGDNGMIICRGVADVGRDPRLLDGVVNIIIHALRRNDKRPLLNLLHRDRLPAIDRIILWQNRHKCILVKRRPAQRTGTLFAEQSEIRLTVLDPPDNIIRAALQQLDLNTRIFLFERKDDLWQPASGNTGKCSNTEMTGFKSVNVADRLRELLINCQQFAHKRQDRLRIGGQRNPLRRAQEQRKAKLPLHRL